MRSALFVPGDSERKLTKGLTSGADALFIDLEDSVATATKQEAREITASFLRSAKTGNEAPALYVRVNALDTGLTTDDLRAVVPAAPDGIVLPKSNHGEDVASLDENLEALEGSHSLEGPPIGIIAIVTETALGTLNAGTYADTSKRLKAVSWGAEDLSADIGALRKRHDDGTYRDVFRYARIQTLLGAIAAGVQPLDTVYPDFSDQEGLRRECEEAALDGFTGKMAIHPGQVAIINDVFTPSDEAVKEAQRIIEAFEVAGNPGVLALDGRMLDRPHLRHAQNLLARKK